MQNLKSVGESNGKIYITVVIGSSSERREYEGDFYSLILDMFKGRYAPLESTNGGKWLYILRKWKGVHPTEDSKEFRQQVDSLLKVPKGNKFIAKFPDGTYCKTKKLNGMVLSRDRKDAQKLSWYRASIIADNYDGEVEEC